MNRPERRNGLTIALWANALLLAGILIVLANRGRSASTASAAMLDAAPIAGGSPGVYVMPAQLSGNNWGCYLLDTESQTLVVYQFMPGEKVLRLVAARTYKYDRHLENLSTDPRPRDIEDMLNKEKNVRGSADSHQDGAVNN